MRRMFGALAFLLLVPVMGWAQASDPIQKGTVVVGGGSAVSFERLTFGEAEPTLPTRTPIPAPIS